MVASIILADTMTTDIFSKYGKGTSRILLFFEIIKANLEATCLIVSVTMLLIIITMVFLSNKKQTRKL